MKTKFLLFIFILLILIFSACSAEMDFKPAYLQTEKTAKSNPTLTPDLSSLLQSLDELAELERAGSWFQGLALTESGIRELAEDYAGAVAAAYKELAWAYGMGMLQKEDLEQGLLNILAVNGEETVNIAANAILAFQRELWEDAAVSFRQLFNELDEPDSFGRWLILVCTLEANRDSFAVQDRRTAAAYRSIRARYAQFPEYWYRGARSFSGAIAAEFAENCINISPQGPFAEECRKIIAAHTGLKIDDGLSIKTKMEIEAIITASVNSGNPQILDSLLPLISLPDNPYTVYAVGALRALTNVPGFRSYFNGQAASARGRLAERLTYICRS
ncbi:MAG: hypothetical protein FWD40_11270 [Treponema sp.]|nr:hypothetical protein [Treponema sp.]